jgi:prepilin-type N-terminal cleavage/methylation domain-containing protein
MSRNNNRRYRQGFSIIELLVVIVIVSVVLAAALPGFNDVMARNRIAAQTNDLVAAIGYTRNEAIRRNKNVTICAANAAQNLCTGTDARNWLVWADENADGAFAAGEIIRVGTLNGSDTATLSTTSVTFDRRGLRSVPGAATAVSLALQPTSCATSKKYRRTIGVSTTGLTAVTTANCI